MAIPLITAEISPNNGKIAEKCAWTGLEAQSGDHKLLRYFISADKFRYAVEQRNKINRSEEFNRVKPNISGFAAALFTVIGQS